VGVGVSAGVSVGVTMLTRPFGMLRTYVLYICVSHICKYICIYIHKCMYIYIHIYKYDLCVYIYICICINIFIYVYINKYIHVCMYMIFRCI